MRPIVDGLQAEFGPDVTFLYMNAADGGEGQRAFEQLGLPGHPSYVIFLPDGAERFRTFGVVAEDTLARPLADTLAEQQSAAP